MTDLPAPNWYDDPDHPGQLRWWDGTKWSGETRAHPGSPGVTSPGDPSAGASATPVPARALASPASAGGPAQVTAGGQPPAAPAQRAAASLAEDPPRGKHAPAPLGGAARLASQLAPPPAAAPAAAVTPAPAAAQVAPAASQARFAAALPVASAQAGAEAGAAGPPVSSGPAGELPPASRRTFLPGRMTGLPVWAWGAAAVLVIVVVVVVVVVALAPGGSSPASSSRAAASDPAMCHKADTVLEQQLGGTSLADLTNQVIASPKNAAPALENFTDAARQGAQAASADPRLHNQLDTIADDAGFASVAAQTGMGNLGADLTKLAQDVGQLDATCGISPSFAQ